MSGDMIGEATKEIAQLVDSIVERPVLVVGSLPTEARDLDLLVRPEEEAIIASALAARGFSPRGVQWVDFRHCSVVSIDLVPAARWRLPPEEFASLFSEARPIPGFRRLVRPAPHHALLIIARRLARSDGRLDDRLRARVCLAVEEHPDAWRTVREHASRWGAALAAALLERAFEDRSASARWLRARATAELVCWESRELRRALVTSRSIVARQARPRIVSISGLDGAGKSFQAASLRDTLERLGYEAVVEHSPSYNPLYRMPEAVRTALLRLVGRLVPAPDRDPYRAPDREAQSYAESAGRRFGVLFTHGLAMALALSNAVGHWRATFRHLMRRRIVICDRYTLDAAVHLRDRYGERTHLHPETMLLQTLSPPTLSSFLLDISPEAALARKSEQFTLHQLRRHARLYCEEHERLGVVRLDGEQPREALCARVARDVWSKL